MNRYELALALAILGSLAETACAPRLHGEITQPISPDEYEIVAIPRDESSRFELALVSKSARKICLSVDDWPNNIGQVAGGSTRAIANVNGEIVGTSDANFGYCIGRLCQITINPGAVLRGYVSYDSFIDPSKVRSASVKSLKFNVVPHPCFK